MHTSSRVVLLLFLLDSSWIESNKSFERWWTLRAHTRDRQTAARQRNWASSPNKQQQQRQRLSIGIHTSPLLSETCCIPLENKTNHNAVPIIGIPRRHHCHVQCCSAFEYRSSSFGLRGTYRRIGLNWKRLLWTVVLGQLGWIEYGLTEREIHWRFC